MYPRPEKVPLERFFSGLTEQTFEGRLGVADPPLVEYLASLLARFVRFDAICAMRDLAGRRLDEVAKMLDEADHRLVRRPREAHRHIGDFTLFWSGVFPEALRRLQDQKRRDHLLDYPTEGKQHLLHR